MLFEYVLRTLWMLNMSHLNHHFLLWPLCVIFSGLFFSISLHFVQPTLPSLQGAVPVVFDLLFAAWLRSRSHAVKSSCLGTSILAPIGVISSWHNVHEMILWWVSCELWIR